MSLLLRIDSWSCSLVDQFLGRFVTNLSTSGQARHTAPATTAAGSDRRPSPRLLPARRGSIVRASR